MKLGTFDFLSGHCNRSIEDSDGVDVRLRQRKSFWSLNHFDVLNKDLISNLFRKQRPLDHRHLCHQPIDVRAILASLERGERKISKLEDQINTLESDKCKLNARVSDQTKVIALLKKTVFDQTKELSKLNNIIISQKDKIEEINTKGEATQNILQWYNQTNDNLCKRLVDTNNELVTLKKFVGKNLV